MVARARETKGCFGLGNPVHAEQFGGTTVTSCHVSNDALRMVTPALAELFGGFKSVVSSAKGFTTLSHELTRRLEKYIVSQLFSR